MAEYETEPQKKSNTGLIIGIVAGVGCLAVVILILLAAGMGLVFWSESRVSTPPTSVPPTSVPEEAPSPSE